MPNAIRALISLVSLVAISSTSLGSVEPAAAVRVITDVAYLAADRTEKLDIYLPAQRAPGKLSPALVWIHGGGFSGGTKNESRAKNICGTLAQNGYVAVSVDYKLGQGAWPTNLHDCKNAVRFLRAHASEYAVDHTRIAVAGGSAGGHLALMVGLTTGQPQLEPAAPYAGRSSSVRAIMNFYGVTDLLTRRSTDKKGQPTSATRDLGGVLRLFGAKSDDDPVLRIASPVTHLSRSSPPILTLHGRADATVDYMQAEELDRVARERGARHEVIFLDGIGHTFDLQTWAKKPLPRDLRPVVLAFLEKHLGPP
ncbi:MAG: alpha/beta hydrolase [Opitutaceae bacterium]|nr:alpha/beta hydrolase [Opitutaceae bacterium]